MREETSWWSTCDEEEGILNVIADLHNLFPAGQEFEDLVAKR